MPVTDITAIQSAIESAHKCDATYLESKRVTGEVQGHVARGGLVDIFEVSGHPKAKRCYGWRYREGNKIRTVTVLEIPPVDSPETAVKAAIRAAAHKKPLRLPAAPRPF
jgi:hypothetical protein